MIGWKRLYPKFIAHLESLDANVGRLELLLHVQAWLKASLNQWTPELRKRYGLDEYATLDFERFPLADASFSPGEELRLLRANPPGAMGSFAMLSCDFCGWSQTESGEPWERKTHYLQPATKEVFARWKSRNH
jgi:hypothetical protein